MMTYRGSRGIAPRINFGTRWRWVVSYTSRPLPSGTHRTGRWVGPRAGLDPVAKRRDPTILPVVIWNRMFKPVA